MKNVRWKSEGGDGLVKEEMAVLWSECLLFTFLTLRSGILATPADFERCHLTKER